MAQLLQALATTSFVLAVVFLAVAIVLFVVFDIRGVVGELTGRTATTEIAKIREQGTTRQYKGKSLQSIILDDSTGSTDFSLDKLDFNTERSGESYTSSSEHLASEAETSLLGATEAGSNTSECATSLLGSVMTDSNVSECATSLLGSAENSEQETKLLDDTVVSEQQTSLLTTDDTNSGIS